jgi:hypothetical protein
MPTAGYEYLEDSLGLAECTDQIQDRSSLTLSTFIKPVDNDIGPLVTRSEFCQIVDSGISQRVSFITFGLQQPLWNALLMFAELLEKRKQKRT